VEQLLDGVHGPRRRDPPDLGGFWL
jgi:hypothetical protein